MAWMPQTPKPITVSKTEAPAVKAVEVLEPAQIAIAEKLPEPAKEAPQPPKIVGTCDSWIAAAGITEVEAAKKLIQRESGCNPNAVNPTSGACGIGQSLPCSKMGCAMGDGLCQMVWMKSYTLGRYGSFANALAFHYVHNWY